MKQIAALYVITDGHYYGLEGVDPWDIHRNALLYAGPWPVICHPPCERWGRFWGGAPKDPHRFLKGDDGGCFASALAAVRKWKGVLEHPATTAAWEWFGIAKPPKTGGWVEADDQGGWTCHVEQGHYGHRARKATFLYAKGVKLPELKWGISPATHTVQNMCKKERETTPIEFRDLLISIVRTAK
jgi:hypothetical protein